MKKQFVTYEIALKLKELGFNFPCFSAYTENGNLMDIGNYADYDEIGELDGHSYSISCLSPIWQQCIDWFREMCEISIEILYEGGLHSDTFKYSYQIMSNYSSPKSEKMNYYKCREQAILKAIKLCQKEK